MKVTISAEAEHDLEAIGDYIARDNPARAITFLGQLRAKCSAVAEMPRRYPPVSRYESHGIRRRLHDDYWIFYRVESDRAVIVHVLHGAMDYGSILFTDGDGNSLLHPTETKIIIEQRALCRSQ